MTKKLPVFAAKDVCEYTRRILVVGVVKSKDIGESKGKYCKSCKMKHLAGKHTAEGKRRCKEYLSRKKDGGRRKLMAQNETAVVENVGDRTRKQKKCFVCRKEHFPYCKSERGVCKMCKKHHQPFCKRKKLSLHTQLQIPQS